MASVLWNERMRSLWLGDVWERGAGSTSCCSPACPLSYFIHCNISLPICAYSPSPHRMLSVDFRRNQLCIMATVSTSRQSKDCVPVCPSGARGGSCCKGFWTLLAWRDGKSKMHTHAFPHALECFGPRTNNEWRRFRSHATGKSILTLHL